MAPVADRRVAVARDWGMANVEDLALATRLAGVPFSVACALMEKESKGRNIYGHDHGGALSTALSPITVAGITYPKGSDVPVTPANAGVFLIKVAAGEVSNGMGPGQLTWAGKLANGNYGGFFRDMLNKGMLPWVVLDNMTYGLQLLHDYKAVNGTTWEDAGAEYNGARSYGVDFAAKVSEWRMRLH